MMCKYITKYAEISQQNFDCDIYTPILHCSQSCIFFMAARARSALEWDFIDSARKNSLGSWFLLVVASGWGRIGFRYCAIYQLIQNKKTAKHAATRFSLELLGGLEPPTC